MRERERARGGKGGGRQAAGTNFAGKKNSTRCPPSPVLLLFNSRTKQWALDSAATAPKSEVDSVSAEGEEGQTCRPAPPPAR